jgi:HlyD family secretion protein
MDMANIKSRMEVGPTSEPALPPPVSPPNAAKRPVPPTRLPSIVVGAVILAVIGLSIWYLVRPQPLLVQGEADATRMDIAARVDGRVAEVPVERGQDLAAGPTAQRSS